MDEVRYGPARVGFHGDPDAAHGYLKPALNFLRKTQERARLGGLSILTSQLRLDDNAYCYTVIAGGMATVHIVTDQPAPVEPRKKIHPALVPDFVSGTVTGGYIQTIQATPSQPSYTLLDNFHPTSRCAKEYILQPGLQKMPRLAVEPYAGLPLKNENPNDVRVFSQYVLLKPTMYSGLMRKLVQALMGFGKQRTNGQHQVSRYTDIIRFARPTVPIPPPAPSSAWQQSVTKNGLQIAYDWRFSRTHGLSVAPDGSIWLVEIGMTRGVVAMPLALNPITTSPQFRDALNAAGDAEGLTLLDTFGGFPTGEPIPADKSFDAWVRAGRIVQMLNFSALSGFYQCSSYSSAMGWAFNAKGSEAWNTAYYYGLDGIQRGVTYRVALTLGSPQKITENAAVSGLRTAFGDAKLRKQYPDIIDAAIWKLDRLSTSQIYTAQFRAGNDGIPAALLYVDSLVLAPIATGSASLNLVNKGYLWEPQPAKIWNCIKFPMPEIGWLASHRMKPEWGNAGSTLVCDTIVHVFFAGDELKWVRYFRDPRTTPATHTHTDNFEPCMYQGQWESHDDYGGIGTPPTFYTSDHDDRQEFPASSTTTQITGKSLGYCAAEVQDDIVYPAVSTLFRTKRFSTKTEVWTYVGQSSQAMVAVPFYDREAYYYSKCDSYQSFTHSITYGYQTLDDPWTCNTWRNFPGYTGQWFCPDNTLKYCTLVKAWPHPDGCGPVTDRTVASPSPTYTPAACSDDADAGPWCHVCDDADSMVYALPAPPTPPSVWESFGPSNTWTVTIVNSGSFSPLQTAFDSSSWNPWPLITPDQHDGYSTDEYVEETSNALGQADSMRYSTNINAVTKTIGVPGSNDWPEINTSGLTYIGVIDGE